MPLAQIAVTASALVAGIICFVMYVYATVVAIRARAEAVRSGLAPASDGGVQPRTVSVDDMSKLVSALSRLADSLSQASPAVTSLIGSLVFFAIAAVGSGALRT